MVKKINPDILIINEIDHDIDAYLAGEDLALNARRFNENPPARTTVEIVRFPRGFLLEIDAIAVA